MRGIADGRDAVAMANGLHVMQLERSLGAFFEPGFQQAFLTHQWLIEIANWMYFNSHFVITISFLAWLYLFRNENFNFVRNMFSGRASASPWSATRCSPPLRRDVPGRGVHRTRSPCSRT